jgi:hypothetical protein
MGLFAFLLVFWGDRFDAFDDLLQLTFFSHCIVCHVFSVPFTFGAFFNLSFDRLLQRSRFFVVSWQALTALDHQHQLAIDLCLLLHDKIYQDLDLWEQQSGPYKICPVLSLPIAGLLFMG